MPRNRMHSVERLAARSDPRYFDTDAYGRESRRLHAGPPSEPIIPSRIFIRSAADRIE